MAKHVSLQRIGPIADAYRRGADHVGIAEAYGISIETVKGYLSEARRLQYNGMSYRKWKVPGIQDEGWRILIRRIFEED